MVHQQTASIRRQLSHTISHRTRETTFAAGLGGLLDGVTPMAAATREADLRASFQVFHELVLLQQLITVVRTTWGPPQQWTLDQYQQLVQSICLAQEKLGSAAVDTNSILADAFALRYQFEEIPEKQAVLMALEAVGSPMSSEKASPKQEPTRLPDLFAPTLSRLRCPTIYGYYDTFEQLSRISTDDRLSTTPRESGGDAKLPLTPRSTTLAKYAQLYLEDDVRTRPPWSWERAEGDDLLDLWSSSEDSGDQYVLRHLAGRFEDDRIYTYVNNHTMVFLNPYRILQTSKFTSIYDEQVVLTYAQTPEAQSQLAPHPYAMAKQSLFRLFHCSKAQDASTPTQTFLLSGESGSGKTELAKELLKYFLLIAQPRLAGSDGKRSPKIQLFTSSTMSTLRMRTEETRSIALLEAKGVDAYEIVLLDLHPERWSEMTSVSRSKRLPQIHVGGMFFGFYEDLEHLEDEEQLRMYFKNPHAAKKLSTVLDSNILLEAFGNATTSMNLNSSRFGKTTTLFLSFDHHPAEFQVLGCSLTPFLLEKSRVTSNKTNAVSSEMNFHIFYAMVAGVNASPSMRAVAKELQLDGSTSDSFAYLGQHQHKLFGTWTVEETAKKDVERYQNIIATMKGMGLSQDHQKAIFKILSAVLWLGNVDFEWNTTTLKLEMQGSAPQKIIALLGFDSIERLEQMLFSKRLDMSATGESFDVKLEKGQVYHLRDTLARLLYEIVFYFIVSQLNQATKVDELDSRSTSIKHLDIVDVFGFENLARNSLEQLCINYLSEKLFATELSVLASQHGDSALSLPSKRDVLFAFEHSVGIFASLEELTLLHQAENENALQELKKNQLVVRNLYERNGEWLEDSKRAASKQRKDLSLIFIVRHSKESVIYDAHEFVKKNSDFQYSTLLEGLRRSANAHIVEILSVSKGSSSSSGKSSSSNTLVSQFRSRTNDLTSRHSGSSIPLYLHCIRSNGNAQSSTIEMQSVNLQLIAHHLSSQVQICGGSSYFPIQVSLDVFTSRFRPLFPRPQDHFDVSNVESLAQWVSTLLYDEEARPTPGEMASRIKIEDSSILFSSMELLEGLDLALLACQSRASVQIQSLFRMIVCRMQFLSVQKKRKDLTNELYDLYGRESSSKVQRLLKKYQDKEDELRAKVMAKKKALREEELDITRLATEIESACISSEGGLNAEMVNEILRNDEMRQMLQDNERIVSALREMSLNPQALPAQLADPLLRAFYENVLSIVQTRVLVPKQVRERTMEERVQDLLQHSKVKWTQAADDDQWVEHRDKLEEIGDDPEMLVFYSDDEAFATVLAEFVAHVEAGEPPEVSAVNVAGQELEVVRPAVIQPQRSVEERVREVLENSRGAWSSVAKQEQWQQLRDKLEEIGDDHEMLLFYLDDAEFSVKLAEFTAQVEVAAAQHALVAAAETQDAHEAEIEKELTEMLLKVQFNAELMGAMQQDPYFASSLQNPMLIATMQQVRCSSG